MRQCILKVLRDLNVQKLLILLSLSLLLFSTWSCPTLCQSPYSSLIHQVCAPCLATIKSRFQNSAMTGAEMRLTENSPNLSLQWWVQGRFGSILFSLDGPPQKGQPLVNGSHWAGRRGGDGAEDQRPATFSRGRAAQSPGLDEHPGNALLRGTRPSPQPQVALMVNSAHRLDWAQGCPHTW